MSSVAELAVCISWMYLRAKSAQHRPTKWLITEYARVAAGRFSFPTVTLSR